MFGTSSVVMLERQIHLGLALKGLSIFNFIIKKGECIEDNFTGYFAKEVFYYQYF
jgi:hypothetical protein